MALTLGLGFGLSVAVAVGVFLVLPERFGEQRVILRMSLARGWRRPGLLRLGRIVWARTDQGRVHRGRSPFRFGPCPSAYASVLPGVAFQGLPSKLAHFVVLPGLRAPVQVLRDSAQTRPDKSARYSLPYRRLGRDDRACARLTGTSREIGRLRNPHPLVHNTGI